MWWSSDAVVELLDELLGGDLRFVKSFLAKWVENVIWEDKNMMKNIQFILSYVFLFS